MAYDVCCTTRLHERASVERLPLSTSISPRLRQNSAAASELSTMYGFPVAWSMAEHCTGVCAASTQRVTRNANSSMPSTANA